jgi:hypothetical protein
MGGSTYLQPLTLLVALGVQESLTQGRLTGVPSHILLGHPWLLQHPIVAMMVIFLDAFGLIFMRIDNVNIRLLPGSIDHCM